jgi:hypothetical protein
VDKNGAVFFEAGVKAAAVTQAGLPERVLEFPAGRSLGQLFIEDEAYERRITGFQTVEDEWAHQTFAGLAVGKVKIPAGKRVRLSVWAVGAPDLSALAKLDPDAIDQLDVAGFTLSDQAMADLAHLTGLRQLRLNQSKVSARGFSNVGRLKNLEYLTLPLNLGDRDLAVLKELSKLKGLYVFYRTENQFSNEGLKILGARQSLEELMLGGGTMDDAGLEQLKGLQGLTYLNL